MIASGNGWTLDDNGLLRVFCVGDMPWSGGDMPWVEYAEQITAVEIADGVTDIAESAFDADYGDYPNLASVTIANSVTTIGKYAFYACDSLTSVTIGAGVTYIGKGAFENCGHLTSDIILDSVTKLDESAFENCYSLTSVTIGDNVTYIGKSAFAGCNGLTSVIIPDSVTSINVYAFHDCYRLTSVTIGNGVTYIGASAFFDCNAISDVYYTGTASQWNAIEIGIENDALTSANIHYNYSPTPSVTLSGIAVTTPPTKTVYLSGETFDPSGMIITATYSDDSTAAVTGYAVSPSGSLTTSDRVITVSYTEGGVTATASVAVTVRRTPDLKLIFNGVDFSDRLSTYRVSYETNFRKVVTALNGTEYFGNGTRRPIITFTLFPMTDAQAKAVYDALKVMVSSCTYTDKATNTDRTAKFRVTSSLEYVFGLRSVDGNRYYKGGEIVLRGVTCLA